MATEPQFLTEFTNAMNKLQEVKRNIQTGVEFKTTFTNNLKTQLGNISNRMGILAGLIRDLKQRSDGYETQINANSNSINQKQAEVEQLKQQIQDLNSQKENLTNQLASQQQTLQASIDQKEAELRDLNTQLSKINEQKATLENQLQSVNTELQNRGDQQATHATEIDRLTKDSQKQLAEQQERLNASINEKQQKIEDLERQLGEKEQAANRQQQELDRQKNDAQIYITELGNQVNALTQQNEQLKNNLISATQAIADAAETLENITNNVPNAETQREVDELIRQITQQIEGSIENIGRAVQGQPLREESLRGQSTRLPSNTQINLMDNRQQTIQLQLNDLISQLNAKYRQSRNNKYLNALNAISTAENPSEIQNILRQNQVEIKNNSVFGGKNRKTKKNKKQKGGFTYKISSKRKSIKTNSSSVGRGSYRKSSK
jgi:chromosome segregation ATPase